MCGIFVFINKNFQTINKINIQKCFDSIKSRGTDEFSATYISHDFNFNKNFNEKSYVIMASSRFSTQGSNNYNIMPLESEKGNLICLNGDIYNFEELKRNYLSKETLKSDGDTEVFLNMYEKYDKEFINYLNGDYAAVIFDIKNKKIFCSVDYYTSKPLFFFENNDFLILSSDIKTIEIYIGKSEIKDNFILHFLKYNQWLFSSEDYSIDAYENIRQLSGKFFLEYNLSKKLKFKSNVIYKNTPFEKKNFDNLFEESVRLRSISNTKNISLALSGGLDSSAISLAMSKLNIFQKTYSTENFGDDKKYLNYVLDNLKEITHEEFKIGYERDHIDNIRFLSSSMRLPTPINGDSLGNYKLFKSISEKNGKEIIITGHGGDELFGCNENHFINILNTFIKNQKFISSANYLLNNLNRNNLFNSINYFLNLILKEKKMHYRVGNSNNYFNIYERQSNEFNLFNFRQSALLTDFISINNNISLRFPMLDKNLRGIINIPFEEKVNENFDRLILRNYMNKDLNKISIRKSKQGMRLLTNKIYKDNENEIFESLYYSNNKYIEQFQLDNLKKKDIKKSFKQSYLIKLFSVVNL